MSLDLRSKLSRLTTAGPGSRAPMAVTKDAAVAEAAATPPQDVLRTPPPITEEGARQARVSQLREMLGRMASEERSRLRVRELSRALAAAPPEPLPGATVETAHGLLHRVDAYLEPAHTHGRVAIARAPRIDARTIAKLALDPTLEGLDPRRFLYLDTETTGLAGGSGTIPFLIGLGWFEDDSFRLEQLLLRRPGEEAPLLHRLRERVEWASAIVSYNGKSFDWPLLRSRFVLNRVPTCAPAAHLDLLHCARRVFKRRLGHVRLVHLEEHVLGLRREHDIDGAEIPERFWELVRGADGSRLAPVIEHNANDIVALAAILVNLVERYEELRPEHEPADRLGVARVAALADDAPRAARYAESAAEAGGPRDVTVDALWLSSELARRRGDHSAQRDCLARALEAAGGAEAVGRLHLALAKHHEHKTRDLLAALFHARAAAGSEGEADRDHRVARLLRKLERRSEAPGD